MTDWRCWWKKNKRTGREKQGTQL